MGYSGARGGLDAILAAESLVRTAREADNSPRLTTEQITGRMRLAVDRVMGEGSLYDPETAADALRQAEGDVIEPLTSSAPTSRPCRDWQSVNPSTQTK